MERNLELKSSSDEETDRSNDDAGTGRSYDCVFCKRGFNTAQALGGHMNIHRKDRAKPRPNSTSLPSISTNFDEDYYATLRGYPAIHTYPPPPPPPYSAEFNYQTFLPASGWGSTPSVADGIYVQSPQILNRVEEDWQRNLRLQIGPSDHMDAKREDGSEADELDLELRLGHDP